MPAVDGWRISGSAVLTHDAQPCRLDYVIVCDRQWRTIRCDIEGFLGTRDARVALARDARSRWTVNHAAMPTLHGCVDVDLGFSPVTNLLPIRRLALDEGGSASVRAAWVRFPELTVEVLEQVYTRRSADRYLYESGNGAFRRELTIDESGLVVEYPGLWIAESVVREGGSA